MEFIQGSVRISYLCRTPTFKSSCLWNNPYAFSTSCLHLGIPLCQLWWVLVPSAYRKLCKLSLLLESSCIDIHLSPVYLSKQLQEQTKTRPVFCLLFPFLLGEVEICSSLRQKQERKSKKKLFLFCDAGSVMLAESLGAHLGFPQSQNLYNENFFLARNSSVIYFSNIFSVTWILTIWCLLFWYLAVFNLNPLVF